MSESSAFQTLKRNVCLPRDRFERVENGLGEGMPDVNYCMEGAEGWIELKAPNLPARATTPLLKSQHQLSQAQVNWFIRQKQARGRAFLYIATTSDLLLIKRDDVVKHGLMLNELPLEELKQMFACWTLHQSLKSARVQRWEDLREILIA